MKHVSLSVAAAVALSLSSVARADIIQVELAGTVTTDAVNPGNDLLGAIISIVFTYDTDTAPTSDNGVVAMYPTSTLNSFTIGALAWTATSGVQGVVNDVVLDSYQNQWLIVGDQVDGLNPIQLDLAFFGPGVIGSTALPDITTLLQFSDILAVFTFNDFLDPALSSDDLSIVPVPLEIFEIQGSGLSSPFEGCLVTSEDNIVTAVGLDGFFIQTPDAGSDTDPMTSEGIFVFTDVAPGVAVGDAVNVTALVNEFFGFTELSTATVSVVSSGNPLPTAVTLGAATPSPDPTAPTCGVIGSIAESNFECLEGMLVSVGSGVVTGPNQRFNVDPVAEVFITAASSRTFREPGIEFSGLPSLPVWDGNPEVFELDPDKLGLPNQIIPAGSSFNATGVLGFEFGGYELFPTDLTVDPAPLPVPVRPREAGEFTLGTLNLFRLFDDVDDPSSTNAQGDVRDDFVASTAEYLRRRTKFAAYILDVLDAPDVLSVQEAEKIEVLQDLAADINALDPAVVYTAFLEEGNDIGTIDVGFMVRDTVQVDSVIQLGKDETFTNPITLEENILHDRPPLLLEGRFPASGDDDLFMFKALVVHNRSRAGIDDPVDGVRVRTKRLEQAQSIAQMVEDEQGPQGNRRMIVLGDFNAFEFTDGFVDVVGAIKGDFDPSENLLSGPDLVNPDLANVVDTIIPMEERYSFIFRGNAQTLDHALLSRKMQKFVRGAEFGRGNADAAADLINDDTMPFLALRSSDHDGLVVYIQSNPDEFEGDD